MKKIFLFILISFSLFTNSCNDFLDQLPENSVTNANVWTSENDAVSVFNSMQYYLRAMANEYYFWVCGDLRAREFSAVTEYYYKYIYSNELESFYRGYYSWSTFYKGIALANLILDNIDDVPMDVEKIKYLKGSAYYVRAFIYYRLLIIWGEVPLITTVDDVVATMKSSKEVIFEQIIKDLEAASKLLKPWSEISSQFGSTIACKQYPALGAVEALQSYVYAWMGSLENNNEYLQLAITYATNIIDSKEYKLVDSPEEVCEEVMFGNSSEGIYEIEYNQNETGIGTIAFHIVGYGVRSDITLGNHNAYPRNIYQLTPQLIEEIFDETGDLRLESYFYDYKFIRDSMNIVVPYKWREPVWSTDGNMSFRGVDANLICFRLADIHLLRAELYNKVGEKQLAIKDLDLIRKRAGLDGYAEAKNGELKLAILKERRRELWQEGHRFFDLVRNDEVRNMLESFTGVSTQDIEEGIYYFPVPLAAFTKNPAMRQNKYWERMGL